MNMTETVIKMLIARFAHSRDMPGFLKSSHQYTERLLLEVQKIVALVYKYCC
jgi:hypothetical protein